jgi:hypothetical protein
MEGRLGNRAAEIRSIALIAVDRDHQIEGSSGCATLTSRKDASSATQDHRCAHCAFVRMSGQVADHAVVVPLQQRVLGRDYLDLLIVAVCTRVLLRPIDICRDRIIA